MTRVCIFDFHTITFYPLNKQDYIDSQWPEAYYTYYGVLYKHVDSHRITKNNIINLMIGIVIFELGVGRITTKPIDPPID